MPDREGGQSTAARLLVVDDAPATLEVLQRNLAAAGYHVLTATSAGEAVRMLAGEPVDLVITDLKMPGASGLDLTRHVRQNLKHTEIMIITGYPSVESAVQAVKNGAEEYLSKPFTDEELLAAVARVLDRLNARSARAPAQRSRLARYGLVGDSPVTLALLERIAALASGGGPVLLLGEAGSGREAVARALHGEGPRAAGPFVSRRCGGVPDESLLAELFGSRGRFPGLLALAAGGSLYLADIPEAGPALQARLARWLAGPGRRRRAPRLIASSEGEQDLFSRELFSLLGERLAVPSLGQRAADVPMMVEQLASRLASAWRKKPLVFEPAALEALRSYSWPGNLPELHGLVRRLVATATGEPVQVADLPARLRFRFAAHLEPDRLRSLREVEAEHIRGVLTAVGGNKARAAQVLDIDRKTLRDKLQRYGLTGRSGR